MEEDEEICRVCRSEATPEQPLFHPCKCSGSIRYVHQDCLIEWLAHSRKKYCELCEHPFTFTPVYRQDMPDVLPVKLFFLQLKKKCSFALLITFRALLVSFVWLILLPYFTIWVWRLYFYLGNNLSKHLSKLHEMKHQVELSKNLTTVLTLGAFLSVNDSNSTMSALFQDYKSNLTLRSFLADCFEGQVITCVVVIVFVAVFLLREWVVQNIPMDNPVIDEPAIEDQQHQQNNEFEALLNRNRQPIDLDVQFNRRQSDEFDRPPSPIALDNGHIWFNNEQIESSLVHNSNHDYNRRAASLPPSLPSYEGYQEETHDFHRAASMEPGLFSHQMGEGSIHRGQPPYAPRMRHAEALFPIRPIQEEEEINEFQPPAPPPPAPVEPPMEPLLNQLNDEDDEEENVEEFEGILEAIGMQGSLWSLIQNWALMSLLISLSLGAAVWMPYLIGMLFIMTEILDLIRLPIKLARLITDPLVDFVIYICTDYISPWIISFYQAHLQSFVDHISTYSIIQSIPMALSYIFMTANQTEANIPSSNSTSIVVSIAKFLNETEPIIEDAFSRYQSLATGQSPMDRFACIAVGYLVVTVVSCWYLTRTNNFATAAFGRTAQEALRHQGIIFKVGMFIIIELALFPIVCGYLLDFSTLPLFKTATMIGRLTYLRDHPVPSIFLHWFLGTGFMFLFAVLVTLCREVVRPGVMWFIRDPNDPQFHPIREIVERPVLFQLRKIGASALIYITVILVGVGGVVHLINKFASGILPLKWSLSNSLSVLPIDLIVMQVGLPAMVKYIQPRQTLKQLFIIWMKATCRQLRLTSFMLGGRHPEEEGSLLYHSWSAWIQQRQPSHYPEEGTIDNIIGNDVSYIWDGQLLRVPRHDSVPITERRRMLIPLDNYTLEPLDETDRRFGHPAATAPGGEEVNTIVVYSPPGFKQRLLFFMGFMWFSIIVFFCTVTIIPVMLGRFVFTELLSVENNVHDIYSFVVGGSIILSLGAVVHQMFKSLQDIFSQSNVQNRVSTVWNQSKQWFSWTARWVFFIVTFGLMIPISFGILIELYFVLPLRQLGEESPSMEVLPIWAHGFICMNGIHRFIQIFPNNAIRELIDTIFRGGIHQMRLDLCIRKIVGPILILTLTAASIPFITAYVNMQITARTNPELRIRLVQAAYPIALIGLGGYYLIKLGSKFGTRLAQNIREDNYLIGRTLHNLDQ